MTKKELFQKFSEENKELIPFCLHYDWWNEVVLNDWDVAIISNGSQVFGVMPYFIRKKGPWTLITNPHFTPYCGPFLVYPEGQKTAKKIAFEHDSYAQLIDQLPDFSEYSQNFHLAFSNTLSFLWKGFEDSSRFTYVLDLTQNEETLWSNLRENNRRQIKKAEKNIQVEESTEAALLEHMLQASFENKIESDYFERMLQYAQQHQCGQLWKAVQDSEDSASLLCIWDHQTAYYLVGGSSAAHKNSGAMSLLLWHAIQHAKKLGKQFFNFEGSSIPAVEKYLRGFGGELSPFRRLSKYDSKSLQLAKKLKR
ncbi:MAG: GNAT family N-acetyltransferase [Flavobacteriales bacterium]|nr:GNAT family N-acetyltransferase [Flavobacteriales bacterium]